MDPFAKERPVPPRIQARIKFSDGYPVFPVQETAGYGSEGYDNNYRVPQNVSQRFARNDFYFQDPGIQGVVYPAHLAYRRKNGDAFVTPPKPEDRPNPNMRIPPQTALNAAMVLVSPTFHQMTEFLASSTFNNFPQMVTWPTSTKVLRFYGYYVERLAGGDPQFPEYGYRVRKVVVFYHMEDDTVSVFEPHLENSGLEQGVTCPRGRYYWPRNGVKTDMQPFRINDFKIGKDYPIRHYLIHLYDADDFTKRYWEQHFPMDSIGTPEPERNDPVLEKQNILRDRQHQLADYKKNFQPLYPRKPYHWDTPDDKKMLFVGVMDDTNFPLARCRPVAVWYYFVDETIRVTEFRIENDAHQFGTVLNSVIRRGRIPKSIHDQQVPSSLGPIEKPKPEFTYYGPQDLCVGNTVWFYGRKILLVECTEWTRRWWKENTNKDMPTNIEWKSQYIRRWKKPPREIVVPEHDGFGTHEDSMRSVYEVDPQPRPPNDLPELCYSDDIFKFSARLFSRHPDAAIPEYSILYYMADNSIAVYEHKVPGDASYGKKFMARQQCPIPEYQEGPFQRSPLPAPRYTWQHFLPGNILNLWGIRFLLTVPDQHIFRVIDKHNLYTDEQRALIRDAIKNAQPQPAPAEAVPLTPEQMEAEVVPRAEKCMQRIKYWILHNPSFLLYLLSEGDSGDACIITGALVEKVCKAGNVDTDPYSAQQIVNLARAFYKKNGDDHLYVEEFLKYVFSHGKGLKECADEVEPLSKSPLLKFRLDLHH